MSPANTPIRVLVLIKGLGRGGAERLVVNQVTRPATTTGAGRELKFEVAYLRPDKDQLADEIATAGVTVHCFGGGRPWPLGLARLLRDRRPAIVHSHSPMIAAVAAPLVRSGLAGRSAHVYTEHNRWPSYRALTRFADALTFPLHRMVWAVSEDVKASVEPEWLRRRTDVLIHGVDVASIARIGSRTDRGAVRRSLGIPDDALVAINIANVRADKAHDVLFDAFDRAAFLEPRLHLVVIGLGTDGPDLLRRAASSPHADRLHLLGRRADAIQLTAACDVMVLSSDHEGLPVSVMEALALGRPVVSTAVGGIPEMIGANRGGRLVPPRDPDALAAALVWLAGDREQLDRLGCAARERSSAFDGEHANAAMATAYRRIAAS